MRTVYLAHTVGDTCAQCPKRKGDQCSLFNELLFSRAVATPKGEEGPWAEYSPVDKCRNAPTKVTP